MIIVQSEIGSIPIFQIIKTNNQEDVEEVNDMFVGLTLLHLACVFVQEDVLSYFLRYLSAK